MKVTSEEATATVRRIARITEDHPVIHPAGYRRAFRVDTVEIEYTWANGEFTVASRFHVHMNGHWVKKDGTDALDRATGMRPEYEDWSARTYQPQYDFLKPIVALLRPNADLSMMTLNETEVNGQ
jgi:hypothetical protein